MYWKKEPTYSGEIQAITALYTAAEDKVIESLLSRVDYVNTHATAIHTLAAKLTEHTRQMEQGKGGVSGLVSHYDLSTDEGIVLMCVAEALLRIPDSQTEKLLISDKLSGANWERHLGQSESSFVNVSTWGLSISGKILSNEQSTNRFKSIWKKMLKKTSEGVIRQAVKRAIKLMSEEFVLGRNIDEAIKRGRSYAKQGYTFSFDMLGEAALTKQDADRYFKAYADAIEHLGKHIKPGQTIFQRPGVSVKLSALYPRYEFIDQERAIPELASSLKQLALHARDLDIALTIDAEEADRLDISLQIFKQVFVDSEFSSWEGLGLAVQAYQKRAVPVVEWLVELAKAQQKRIQVRLVKGAYWDTEIKQAQMNSWVDYPVFTRKTCTDVSFLACAKILLDSQQYIYPKFATHNAHSVAAILTYIEKTGCGNGVEFQNLQGMGKSLHEQILNRNIPCRIYAPVGSHQELLPYLVRRLLENGANTSFVNQIANKDVNVEELVADPVKSLLAYPSIRHDRIPLPIDIFQGRVNSRGINISCFDQLNELQEDARSHWDKSYYAFPLNSRDPSIPSSVTIHSPASKSDQVGEVWYTNPQQIEQAVEMVKSGFENWNAKGVDERGTVIDNFADLLEANTAELIVMMMREAGKVLQDCIDEIREAVDFCRYYALQATQLLKPKNLTGYTGEENTLSMQGRGVILCISPWNFPIAIFVGQMVAALSVGNTVVAKPAEQTSLCAAKVVELFYHAGLPEDALQLVPGKGDDVGSQLVAHPDVAGVMFTGSTQTAKLIQRQLADKDGPIVPLIAETGGMNAMIADSSALIEQLVKDVVHSAFGSAGQRCSALRVLFVQDDIAEKVIDMLKGAMHMLEVGMPKWIATDLGPVIDSDALQMLRQHETDMQGKGELLCQLKLPGNLSGYYFPPQLYELDDFSLLKKEVFGPILHVVRFKRKDLDNVIDQINASGYGLTFGIHSRINSTIGHIQKRIRVGNVYVNRNMIGAVVGLQPFGGCGLSGTGPKAGGPHYLAHLCREVVVSVDTTASGGNASLMALGDD